MNLSKILTRATETAQQETVFVECRDEFAQLRFCGDTARGRAAWKSLQLSNVLWCKAQLRFDQGEINYAMDLGNIAAQQAVRAVTLAKLCVCEEIAGTFAMSGMTMAVGADPTTDIRVSPHALLHIDDLLDADYEQGRQRILDTYDACQKARWKNMGQTPALAPTPPTPTGTGTGTGTAQ